MNDYFKLNPSTLSEGKLDFNSVDMDCLRETFPFDYDLNASLTIHKETKARVLGDTFIIEGPEDLTKVSYVIDSLCVRSCRPLNGWTDQKLEDPTMFVLSRTGQGYPQHRVEPTKSVNPPPGSRNVQSLAHVVYIPWKEGTWKGTSFPSTNNGLLTERLGHGLSLLFWQNEYTVEDIDTLPDNEVYQSRSATTMPVPTWAEIESKITLQLTNGTSDATSANSG